MKFRLKLILLSVSLLGSCAFAARQCEIYGYALDRNARTFQLAKEAGLTVLKDDTPGFSRQIIGYERYPSGGYKLNARGKKIPVHAYFDKHGKKLNKAETAKLLNYLKGRGYVIPPAYENVWISPHANSHIVYTGLDEAGRTQIKYDGRWTQVSSEHKFDSNIEFGKSLSKIRNKAGDHLKLKGLPKEKVMAAMVLFMDSTQIRVGNTESSKEFGHYGLTTLQKRHVTNYNADEVELNFIGKGHKEHDLTKGMPFDDSFYGVFTQLMDLPGGGTEPLFRYYDEDGYLQTVSGSEINNYINSITGNGFTAKNFRTWHATVEAVAELSLQEMPTSEAQKKRFWNAAKKHASEVLGNTPAIAERSYIDPVVRKVFFSDPQKLLDLQEGRSRRGRPPGYEQALLPIEVMTLQFLEENR